MVGCSCSFSFTWRPDTIASLEEGLLRTHTQTGSRKQRQRANTETTFQQPVLPGFDKSEYCIYCHDLDAKVIPKMVRLMSKARAKFSELLPNYFALWLVYEKKYELHHQPGLHLELFEHYVNRHSCAAACREHRNTEFPCGLRRWRGDLGRAKQLTLHSLEAELEFSVKKLRKLLDSYLFHRAANLHQRPQLDRLLHVRPLDIAFCSLTSRSC